MLRYEEPKLALRRIFTADVYDRISEMAGQPHRTITSAACKYVIQKTRNHDMDDPSASADDLLRHFGIQQRRGFLGSRSSTPSSNTQPPVDHVKHIENLAAVYCEQNPDGGSGYSFGALLERYLVFHLIYYYNQLANIHEYMIGGEGRRYIDIASPDGRDIQENCPVSDGDGELVASVTLHWVRGSSLIRAGPEPVKGRVLKSLRDFGAFNNPNILYLCHGTNMDSATAILSTRPDCATSTQHADFGPEFYLTDSLDYAVHAGCQASVGRMESAVVVFPIPRDTLEGRIWDLDEGATWRQIVEYGCRRRFIKDNNTRKRYDSSPCVAGPISSNAAQVDADRQQPRALPTFKQWVFKEQLFTDQIFGPVIARREVHVFRIVYEGQDEWRSTSSNRRERR